MSITELASENTRDAYAPDVSMINCDSQKKLAVTDIAAQSTIAPTMIRMTRKKVRVMKGEHNAPCVKTFPSCLCNRCKRDNAGSDDDSCCFKRPGYCPIDDCPNFEPDDVEEGDE